MNPTVLRYAALAFLTATACSMPPMSRVTAPDGGGSPDAGDAGVTPTLRIDVGGGSALTAWDFGPEEIGSASPALALTVTNTTDQPSAVLTVTSPDPFPLDGSSSCAQRIELAPGASCSILIRFDPTVNGAVDGTLAIDGGAVVGSATLALTGSGTSAPDLDTAPPFFDFGVVEFGTTAQTTLSLRNGGDDLVINSVTIGNPIGSGFQVTSTTCGGLLAAGSACDIVAQFTPTAFGQDGSDLTIQTDHGPYTVGTNWLLGHGGGAADRDLSRFARVTSRPTAGVFPTSTAAPRAPGCS